jgi:hypothetical protein
MEQAMSMLMTGGAVGPDTILFSKQVRTEEGLATPASNSQRV